MPALIVGSVIAIVGGIALLLLRHPYGRAGGRAMAKTMTAYGDPEGQWRNRYKGKARFGGWLLIVLGIVGLLLGAIS